MILKIIFIFNKIFARIYNLYSDQKRKSGNFLSQEESIDELLKTNKSLIRWGDGESSILTGGDLYFQQNTMGLFKYFIKIVKTYNSQSNYLIAMPNEFLLQSKDELKKGNKYNIWRYSRYVFEFYFKKKNVQYLDSFIFRENTTLDNSLIEKLWEKENIIFFIHNNYKYFIDFKNKYLEKEVVFFQVTSANSFKQIDTTIRHIQQKQKAMNIKKEDICILISAGPAGKAYVFDLSKDNYKTLDMGHYFDYKFYEIRRHDK